MKIVKISAFAVAFALSLPFGTMMLNNTASATKSDKVTICHATNSHTNPYVVIKVNSSSINELKNPHSTNGHGTHEGGVWYKGIADHSWGDIIPAFESPKGNKYPGQNWSEKGKAIYNNGCKGVVTPPKEEKPTTPTTPTTPTKPTQPTLPTPTNPTLPETGDVLGDVTPVAAENGKGSIPAELPATGMNLAWVGLAAIGGTTYGLALLIRKVLGQ